MSLSVNAITHALPYSLTLRLNLTGSELKPHAVLAWKCRYLLIENTSKPIIYATGRFIVIWQPIWTEGFKDFHTISNAIDKLDKTAQPASDTIPLMLVEMTKMNKSMNEMKNIMHNMGGSMENIEQMTPNIKRMTNSVNQLTVVMTTQIPRMSHLMGRVENKMPYMNFMPFK